MIAEARLAAEPGITDDMTRAVYESLADEDGQPLANYSTIKHFANPPAKAKHLIDFPREPSDALNLGDACHAAVLEPVRFEAEFVCGIKVDRRTTAGKAAWEEFEQQSRGKLVLPPDDYAAAIAMRDAIWSQESVAKAILSAQGMVERSFVWRDPLTVLLCKGRCDRMARWSRWTVVMDYKTARSAASAAFGRDIGNYHYDAQAAFYLDGLQTIAPTKTPRKWLWLVQEKEPPYLHAIYEPSPRLIEQGRRKYQEWLAIYKECRGSGVWPGYPSEITEIDVPAWAMKQTEIPDDIFA